jgi:hypothetical protein
VPVAATEKEDVSYAVLRGVLDRWIVMTVDWEAMPEEHHNDLKHILWPLRKQHMPDCISFRPTCHPGPSPVVSPDRHKAHR